MTSEPSSGGPSWQHEPAPSNPADNTASPSFFQWIRDLDVTRAPDRWLGGVSGGLAHRTGLDLALVRGVIVILAVFGGIGVLLYGLAWALLPEPDGRIHVEQAGRGSWTTGLTGAAALVAFGLWHPNLPYLGDSGAGGLLSALFWIGAVVLFVYWISNRSGRGRAGVAPPDGSRTSRQGPDGGHHRPFGPAPHEDSGLPVPPPADGRMTFESSADASAAGTTGHPGSSAPPLPASSLPYDPRRVPWAGSSSAYPAPEYPAPGYPAAFHGIGGTPPGPGPDTGRPRPARPSGSVTALLIGSATIVAATLLALHHLGILHLGNPAAVALAGASIVLALGVMALGARGRTSGSVGLVAASVTIGALVSSFPIVGGAWIVAQESRTTPVSLRAASDGYSIVAAHTTIDLTGLPRPSSDTTVPVTSLASDVTVIVPEDVAVQIRTRMVLGTAGAASDTGGSSPGPGDGEGALQLSNGELHTDAAGAALILEVRGALSDVSIVSAPGTSTPTPEEDTP